MSAPYRTSRQEPPYGDITPFAHALVAAAPDRLVWGSDWPHVLLETTMPSDDDLVDQLAVWVPDEGTRQRILVDNPERLYGFEHAGALKQAAVLSPRLSRKIKLRRRAQIIRLANLSPHPCAAA